VAGPIMAEDFTTVYYCTAEGVRALDMATGNSRMLRQEHGAIVSLDGVLFGGTILRYTRQNEQGVNDTIFIRTSDGSQVYFANLNGQLATWGENYAAVMQLELPMGTCRQILTGDLSGTIRNLEIGDSWDTIVFPGGGMALIQSLGENGIQAELYDLSDGTLAAKRSLQSHQAPFPTPGSTVRSCGCGTMRKVCSIAGMLQRMPIPARASLPITILFPIRMKPVWKMRKAGLESSAKPMISP